MTTNTITDSHGGFSVIPDAVLLDSRLTPTDVLLYAVIKRVASGATGACVLTTEQLARCLGRSARQVRTCLRTLQSVDLIAVEAQTGTRNLIRVLPPAAGRSLWDAIRVDRSEPECAQPTPEADFRPGSGLPPTPEADFRPTPEVDFRPPGSGLPPIRDNQDTTDKRQGMNTPPTPPADFEAFWKAYPHYGARSSKVKSAAAWREARRQASAEDILAGLEAWKGCADWLKDGGQFVMASDRWLRERRWEERPRHGTARGVDFYLSVARGGSVNYAPPPEPDPADDHVIDAGYTIRGAR